MPPRIGHEQTVRRHFDQQAPAWESKLAPGGSMSSRPAQFAALLREFAPPPARVLDFGCGSGDITTACTAAGFDIRGIDCSPPMIDRARARALNHPEQNRERKRPVQFDLLPPTRRSLPYPDAAFDAIIASSVLEYVAHPSETLHELRRICHPAGILIASVPNMRHPHRWLEQGVRAALTGWLPGSLGLHLDYLRISANRFRMRTWRSMLAEAGWYTYAERGIHKPLVILIARALPHSNRHGAGNS